MKRVTLFLITLLLLSGCAKKTTDVIERYENGNYKKVIIYKGSGSDRSALKAVEYYPDGKVKREIDMKKNPGFTFKQEKQELQKPVEPVPKGDSAPEQTEPQEEEYEYSGPYEDLMNQPGVVTRKLEGEERERVLKAMREKKEEQNQGEMFTVTDEAGNETTKMRKVLSTFEDGSVKHEQIFIVNGNMQELENDIEYYSNGQIRTKVPYEFGKANGKWTNYYRNGKLKTEGSSYDGKHHGAYTQYYENGNPMMKGEFKNGKMDGKWTYYWENGKLKMETFFKDDMEIGPLQRYDENGEPIKRESPFKVGESYNFGNN